MKILALSDEIVPFIYSPQVRDRFRGVKIVIGCGDLAYAYLEYVLTALTASLYFVRGNHDKVVEYGSAGQRTYPHGGVDLHGRLYNHDGLLLGGVAGSVRYRPGDFQYTQSEMWWHVFSLVPGLMVNRLRHGRFLDVFVSHAPPAGIHDQPDLPHQGARAFAWLIRVFQPRIFLHGHVHLYHPQASRETQAGSTRVINAYKFWEIEA
jgi:Icc-related predicted phosphoesterase